MAPDHEQLCSFCAQRTLSRWRRHDVTGEPSIDVTKAPLCNPVLDELADTTWSGGRVDVVDLRSGG